MNKDEIRKKLLEELTALQKAYDIPQIEIDKAVLQFEDLIPLLEDKSNLLEQLADDLVDNIAQRANIGIPDTIPDDMIIENIAQEETTNKTFEVSTKGDDFGKQFSALNATFKEGPYAGRTIEDVWQNEIKKSGKRQGPGPGSILEPGNFQQSKDEYQKLWQMWADENPELIKQLKDKVNEGYTLVDSYAGDPNKTVNQAEALTNIINKPTGGSLGAAKLNDPNIFPEKLDELYDENVHTDFKRNILDQLDYEGKKVLSFFNEHPVVKEAQLNGESVLLGLYKYFGPKFLEKYDNIKNMNAGTKVVLGATKFATKRTYGIGKFLINTLRALDPVGEGIELASKIATKTGVAKTGGVVSKYGTKAGSNLFYELKNQIVWQTAAAVIAGVENGAMAFNSVLDKYGLFPQALKDAGVEIVPYQDVMKEAANNYRYWQSKYWQASKTTSLMYMLDTAIPSVFTGQSMPTRFQKGLTGAMLPPVFNEKTLTGLKLSAEDREFWNIVSGWDVTDTRAKQDKWYHILPGFSLNSNWLQNEMEQTGTLFQPSYYSQVENPNLNEYQQDNHVSAYNRLEKLINRFGKDIEPIAKQSIEYYDTVLKGIDE